MLFRSFIHFKFDSQERKNWSNLPARFVNRVGISIGDMNDIQRGAFFKFLSNALGEVGYNSIIKILAAEAFLSQDERASFFKWSPENYWFAIYGTPSKNGKWAWQFGGHHLSINMTIERNKVISMSPTFLGIEPAVFSLNGKKYESIVDMHKAGYEVFASLNKNQKNKALTNSVPNDVVTGPGKDELIPPNIGLLASKMTGNQKELLLKVIEKWVYIQNKSTAQKRMKEIQKDIDKTSFAWVGTNEVNKDAYFRIQGPSIVIELLSNSANIGSLANGLGHYHTMYRNPKFDYGQISFE